MWSIHVAMDKSYIGFYKLLKAKIMTCIHNMQCNKHMQSIFIATLLFKPIWLAQSILYMHSCVLWYARRYCKSQEATKAWNTLCIIDIDTNNDNTSIHVHACTLEVEMTNVLSAIASPSISSSSSSIPPPAAEYIVKVLA